LTPDSFALLFHQIIMVMKIYNLLLLLLPFTCNESIEFKASARVPDNQQKQKKDKAVAANIVFKSADGGQTWQDISEGLPENFREDDIQRDGFFANDNGLYLHTDNGIYYSKPNSTAPFWNKEIFPDEHSSITPGKTGIFAYNYWNGISQKTAGTSVWSPIFTDLQEKETRTVFETAGGTIFIGSDRGLFKSTNSGITWKQVQAGGWATKLVESNGILLATSHRGIIRSADEGETWETVISEGGVGIDVERIEGGFAAITYSMKSNTRRVRTSYDGGKTWQAIDAGLPAQLSIASIIQVGENFFCGHPDGIFRSSDKGETWKLLLPSIDGKVFNLFVSGNVIYAIPKDGGC